LTEAFAEMDGVIDPPSSLAQMTAHTLRDKVRTEDLFVIRDASGLIGCLLGQARRESYYIGKLAVAAPHRGRGHARALVEASARHARARGLHALDLQSRVELTGNHACFARMGFVVTGATSHPGYGRPTSYSFRRTL
jgi:ribosomal protein S18 acetylase RimI-like enzyme